MPNFVKTVIPIRIDVTVYLVVSLTVDILKGMRARLAFLYSKPWGVYISILFAVPYHLSMMLGFVKSIAFDASGHIQSTTES